MLGVIRPNVVAPCRRRRRRKPSYDVVGHLDERGVAELDGHVLGDLLVLDEAVLLVVLLALFLLVANVIKLFFVIYEFSL
jgi:hypothetical protein